MTTAKGNRKQKLVTCLIDKDGTEVTTLTCTSRKFSLASNSGHNITLGLSEAGCLPHFLACHVQCSDSTFAGFFLFGLCKFFVFVCLFVF